MLVFLTVLLFFYTIFLAILLCMALIGWMVCGQRGLGWWLFSAFAVAVAAPIACLSAIPS